jgi:hypothetical protein
MAKKEKALAGGNAAFGSDGAWTPNICKAIRMATSKYAAIVAKIANRQDDKNSGLKEIKNAKKGSPEYAKRSEQIVGSILELEQLRSQRTLVGGLTPQIVERADKGDFDANMTPQEIYDAVVEDAETEPDSDEGDDDGGQMKLGPQMILPRLRFTFYVKHLPDAFGEHGIPAIDTQLDKYKKLDEHSCSPLGFATYLNSAFRDKKRTTKDRTEAFFGPEWFKDGIRACLTAAATASLCKGDNEGEQEAARIVELLTQCAELDIEAWIAIAGGKDSPLNKVTLTKKTA